MAGTNMRLIALSTVLALVACSDNRVQDFNAPDLSPTLDPVQLQARATGLLSGDRGSHDFEILILETMGRDVYRIDPSEPRFITNPLGTMSAGSFIGAATWTGPFAVIRGSNDLIATLPTAAFLSAQERAAVSGFAQTMKALSYMRVVETRDTLGAPIVTGGTNLSALRCKPAVLAQLAAVLDSASDSLGVAGNVAFPFTLPAGFSNFTTASSFKKLNRGLKARVDLWRGFVAYGRTGAVDQNVLAAALTESGASFATVDPAALRFGAYHNYATASGDLANGNFAPATIRANPRVVAEADAGDARVAAKVRKDPAQLASLQGVSSDYVFTFPTSPSDDIPLLVNVQLFLDRALIYWGLGQDDNALAISNFVRVNDGKLAPVAGLNHDQILREILKQQRYSLLFESVDHFVDYRMFGLVGELGAERNVAIGKTPVVMPIPQNEVNARGGAASCQP
jgi:hypothetical protein